MVKIGQFFKKRAIHKFRKLSSKHKFTSESQKIFDFLRNTSSQAFFDYHFSKTLVYKHFLSPFFFLPSVSGSFSSSSFIIKFLWPIFNREKLILRFSIFWMNQKILSIFQKILSFFWKNPFLKIFTSVLTHFVWGKIDFEIFNFLDKSEDSEHFLKNSIFENFFKCFDSFCMRKNWFWDFQFSGWIRRFWAFFEKFYLWKFLLEYWPIFDPFCIRKTWFWDFQFSGWIRRFWAFLKK